MKKEEKELIRHREKNTPDQWCSARMSAQPRERLSDTGPPAGRGCSSPGVRGRGSQHGSLSRCTLDVASHLPAQARRSPPALSFWAVVPLAFCLCFSCPGQQLALGSPPSHELQDAIPSRLWGCKKTFSLWAGDFWVNQSENTTFSSKLM